MELFYLTQNTRKPIDILYRTDVILLLICMILFCRYSYNPLAELIFNFTNKNRTKKSCTYR